MSVATSIRQYQQEAPPDTLAQRLHDGGQDLSYKLLKVPHGWSYLSQLEYFELAIGELPGKLNMLTAALEPRFASRTMVAKTGQWFDALEQTQKKMCRVDDVAQAFRSLYPDAERLKELCQKLLKSARWAGDIQTMLQNASTALGDFIESRPLRARIGQMESQLERERQAAASGAVAGRVHELEAKLAQARAVLVALKD